MRTERYLGKYRKHHIPHCHPGFWEKFYFTPGDLGYPVFETKFAKVGVYICYDRHFPEGARALGLNGAEIVFNPSATVAGLSEYLWELEQPAHAVANGYFVGAINRVGEEKPWSIGEFYGKSYFCNPRGKIIAQASRDKDEVLVADLDLDMILEVRKVWQFFRDRRPESYGILTTQSGKTGSGLLGLRPSMSVTAILRQLTGWLTEVSLACSGGRLSRLSLDFYRDAKSHKQKGRTERWLEGIRDDSRFGA